MKPFEEQFTAWVDDRLTGEELAEFEKQLAEHPESVAEKDQALQLRKLLQEHPTAPQLTNPDFFNHQLMERIAAETRRTEEKPRVSFWSLPRLAFGGVFCLAVALALYKTAIATGTIDDGPKYFAQVVEAWPADSSISATTVYSPESNVTVVWLDGLDYIPATYALK